MKLARDVMFLVGVGLTGFGLWELFGPAVTALVGGVLCIGVSILLGRLTK